MFDYDERGELAPRDIVSRAIVSQMEKTRHPNVYLDMSHLDPRFVKNRFPGIAETCGQFGIDITKDRIPVRPGAHYMIGGVTVDLEGRTSLPGLWAAGEVTSSGLHGANRLASNSLLENLVYGAHAGLGASRLAQETDYDYHGFPLENPPIEDPAEYLDIWDIRNSLKSLMWRAAGVRRNKAELLDALESIKTWQRYVLPRQLSETASWELQNMLTVAGIIVQAALMREESRGVHTRTDFSATDNEHWQRRLVFRLDSP
jgi:L-aspartate oxidase